MHWQVDERYEGPIVRVKRLRDDVELPAYQTTGAAGFDLALADDLTLAPRELKLASTGLVFAAPIDHMLLITYRSSTPRKWGVEVLNGILDEDYCGDDDECKLQVRNLDADFKTIPKGTRLGQGIFVPISRASFVEAHVMGKSRGGFGSTGTGLEPRPVRREL